MSGVDLDNHRRCSADGAPRRASTTPLNPSLLATVDHPSIDATMMAGGYYLGGSNLSDVDALDNSMDSRPRDGNGTQAVEEEKQEKQQQQQQQQTLPKQAAKTSSTAHPSTAPTAAASKGVANTERSSSAATAATSPSAFPVRKAVAPLSSLQSITPTPPNSKPPSVSATPVATPHAGAPGEDPVRRRRSKDSGTGSEAKEMESSAPATLSASSPTSKASATPVAAASSPHRPSPHKPVVTAALSPPKRAAPANSDIHPTPPHNPPASSSRSVDPSDAARAASQPVAAPKNISILGGVSAPNSTRRCRTTTTAPTAGAPPPLAPRQENFSPMRRVTMTPQAAAASSTTSSALAGPAATGDAPAAGKLVAPSRISSSHNVRPNGTALSATMPPIHLISPATNGPSAPTKTSSTPPPPQFPHAVASGGAYTRPLAATATSPRPPPSPSNGGPTPRLRSATDGNGMAGPPKALAVPSSLRNDDAGSAPTSGEVPPWLAQLNTVLMQNRTTPPAGEDGASQPTLAGHRTFSQASPTAEDDWLNPCSRPKGQPANPPFNAAALISAAGGGMPPPGVTITQHRLHMRGVTGGSPTSPTSTSTGFSPGTSDSHNNNNKSMSFSDSATTTASSRTAPLTGSRWRAEDGAPVRRQYPSRHSSVAASIASVDNVGFIPISQEQRAMSPQSQRWESSGGLSMYSSVGGSTTREPGNSAGNTATGAAPQNPSGAPLGLSRHRESGGVTSRSGSGDIMAPVRLSRNGGGGGGGDGVAAAILSTATGERDKKLEKSAAPPMSRFFALQPNRFSGGDLSGQATSTAVAQRYATSMESATGSASVLSMNEGPSTIGLPLARFMRNASVESAVNGLGYRHAQRQHQQHQSNAYPIQSNSPPTIPQQQQQQQAALALAYPPSLSSSPLSRNGGPAVLSLLPEGLNPEALQRQQQDNRNSNDGGRRQAPTWGPSTPHQPLRQGQVQALDDNVDFTASLTLTPTDAISMVSRATSGVSLAAETTFVQCD